MQNVLWVDHLRYYGPDRRERRLGLRLNERRHEKCLSKPPPLGAAIRHLKVRVPETDQPEGLQAFCRRARSVALLANAFSLRAVGDILMGLVRSLESSTRPSGASIYAELERSEAALHASLELNGQ